MPRDERPDVVSTEYIQMTHTSKWPCRGHRRRALGDLGEKRNTRGQNGTRIYANHHDPYILTHRREMTRYLLPQNNGNLTLPFFGGNHC